MNILCTAFKGKNNSSKILLDLIKTNNKLYLTNSFKTSLDELEKEIKNNKYDIIISFGQAPLDCNLIKIETMSKGEYNINTNFNYDDLKLKLEEKYKVVISNNAGNYLCNNLYYYGLKYITDNNIKTKMIFIHIPKKDKISNINYLANILSKYIDRRD